MKPVLYINASGEQVMTLAVFKQADFGEIVKATQRRYPRRRKVTQKDDDRS